MQKNKIKARLFKLFSEDPTANISSLATSILEHSELDGDAKSSLLRDVMQRAGAQKLVAQSFYKWAEDVMLSMRKTVPL